MIADVAWHGLSIDAPGSPPAELDRTGAVALIPAGDRAFAAAAALTLARSLARRGRRVFLCDLDLAQPRLHVMAGVSRGVGVTDYVLYGASVGHVSSELEERLILVPAGTPVVDFETVFESDRWEALITAATHARACLLLLTPYDLPGIEGVLARAETVVALGIPEECPPLGAHAGKLRVGFRPAAGVAPPPPPDDDVWAPDPAAIGPDPSLAPPPAPAAPRATLGGAPRRRDEGRGGRLLLLLLLLAIALAAAVWMGWLRLPGITPGGAEPAGTTREALAGSVAAPPPEQSGAAADPAPGGAEPTGADPVAAESPAAEPPPPATAGALADSGAPLQGWTLRLGAFRNRSVARQEVERYQAAAPEQLLAVIPVDIGDTRWYRVASVATPDAAAAEVYRGAMAAAIGAGAVEAEGWVARATPFAYLLSEHGARGEAESQVAALGEDGVDAYTLMAPAPGGGERFLVYAGAYADIAEAEAMAELLQEGGWGSASLVERRGTRPE